MAKWNNVMHKALKTFVEQKGLSPNPNDGSVFYKTNNIPISIHFHFSYFQFLGGAIGGLIALLGGARSNSGIVLEVPLEENQWDKEKAKVLRQAFKKTGIVSFLKEKSILSVYVRISTFNNNATVDRINFAANLLGEQLPLLELKPKQECFFCKQANCDDIVEEQKIFYPAHNRCKKEQALQLAQEIDANITSGNYGSAIICALLGGIIGSIPSFLILTFANYLVALLFALIPISAYFGYKKAKGIMSKGTPIVIAFVSIICTFLLVAATFYVQISRELGERILLSEFFIYLLIPELFAAAVQQFLQALLFTVLGFGISWGIISKNNKEKLAKVKSLHGNLDEGDK